MLAATWMDPVLGVDTHQVMVPSPAGPIPTPLPNPFIGMVFSMSDLIMNMIPEVAEFAANVADVVTGGGADGEHGALGAGIVSATGTVMTASSWVMNPVGAALEHVSGSLRGSAAANAGKVKVNGLWAALGGGNATAVVPHLPLVGPLVPPPDDEADLYFGALGVFFEGHAPVRLADMAKSCGFPIAAPTSVVMAIPKGFPVLVLRPEAPDLVSMLTNVIGSALRAAGARIMRALGRTRAVRALRARLKRAASRHFSPRTASALRTAICHLTGEPVDVATGRVVSTLLEFDLPGPIPLAFERHYDSSLSWRDGPLGFGWSHTLHQSVWEERGRIVLREGDGREIEFPTFGYPKHRLPIGKDVWNALDRIRITRRAADRWEVRTADGQIRDFVSSTPTAESPRGSLPPTAVRARLMRIRNDVGVHAIELTYDREGRLEWVRDSAGRLIQFEYDRNARLTAIKLPIPHGRGFYVHSRFEYSAASDLVRAIDVEGRAKTYVYSNHLNVKKTDRTGLTFYYQYDGTDHRARCVRTWGDGGIYHRVLHFLVQKRTTIVEDSYGRVTTYLMNEAGLVTSVTDPTGAKTTYEHDPSTSWLLRTIDPVGAEVVREYDARGNCTAMVGPDGRRTKMLWDGDRLVMLSAPNGAAWELSWTEGGQLVSVRDPVGARVTYQWEKGLLARITSPAGATTAIEYDERHQAARIVAPNGGETTIRYDELGRPTKIRNALGGAEEIRYDALGHEIARQSATGEWSATAYDGEDNVVESRDANRHVRMAYGGFHQVVAREEAGTRLGFEYDLEDRLTAVVNEAGERYTFELDGRGLVTTETSFDGGVRRYLRDPAGRVTEVELPSRKRSKHQYDAVGRLIEVAHSDGAFARYEYDAAGALVVSENETVRVELERDIMGRVVAERVGGVEVRSRYGVDGRVEMTTSLGARAAMIYDPLGEVEQVYFGRPDGFRNEADLRFDRDLLGLEKARRFRNGIDIEWQRDVAGRPIARRTYARPTDAAQRAPAGPFRTGAGERRELEARMYQWRGEDQIAAIIDAVTGPKFYDHDARGRLIRERRPDAVVERAMDAVGNVYRSADGRDRRYGRGGRLESADGVRYEHDEDGNQTLKSGPDGDWHYRWNGHGMLREVERPDGVKVAFEYDPFARRTAKRVVAGDAVTREVRFIWDGHNVVHELDSESGLTTWQWEPESFTPVGKENAGKRWSIASDHLGTPTEMYDEVGRLAWKMQLDVFGVPSFEEGSAEDCPWRWPGQYEDPDSGHSDNRCRAYSARDGRYLSQDPMKLWASTRAYGYVLNPTLETDALGLVANHHTIPKQLVAEMARRNMVRMDSSELSRFNATDRAGTAPLADDRGAHAHSEAHAALSDFLNGRRGTTMKRGTQNADEWRSYLRATDYNNRTVMRDMDDFYRRWLPAEIAAGRYPLLQGEADNIRDAYEHDRRTIRGACT